MATYKNEEKKQALLQFLNCNIEEIKEFGENYFEVNGEEYEVLTDEEANFRWDEELNFYIDECIIPELPEQYKYYFDSDAWKRDARYDGRGHAISRYNGKEKEERVGEEYFYIYRQN